VATDDEIISVELGMVDQKLEEQKIVFSDII
jgi:hypothetical protein